MIIPFIFIIFLIYNHPPIFLYYYYSIVFILCQ
nr:MAG TPA_asm: hypothetical protein [Caudoviricetes sp.]